MPGVLALCVLASAAPVTGQERSLRLTEVVQAPPAIVYRMFSTTEGVRALFPGADALIGDTVGGEYRIAFDPASSPDGRENGTAGCVILRLDPDRSLAFEWRGPPWATEMNVEPFPTWVEVESRAAGDGGTRIILVHHGFGRSGSWDRAHAFFERAWRGALDGLRDSFAT